MTRPTRKPDGTMIYTPEIDAVLRRVYPRHGYRGVQKILPELTAAEIQYRARRIGLRVDAAFRLECCRNAAKVRNRREPDPTPEEIAERCMEIRNGC